MTKSEAVSEVRFGSRLSVFLRSLNVLKLLSDFLGPVASKEDMVAQFTKILDAAALGVKLTPSEFDDKVIVWLKNATTNDGIMSLMWFLYSAFLGPKPQVAFAGGDGDVPFTAGTVEPLLAEYAAAA